jgi:branched-chain amino acid transport system permease protein
MEELTFFGQQVISGLAAGGLYALLALAVVLIYKATDIVNFAQGEMAMICGFFSYTLLVTYEISYPLVFLLVILFGALMGIVGDRLLFRPLLRVPLFSFVIATLGLNLILNSSGTLIWGPEPRALPSAFGTTPISLGELVISREHLAIIIITILFVLVLTLFFRRTMAGLALRAVAMNRVVASLMGINVKRSFSMTWAISIAIGGLVGLLFANVVFLDVGYMSGVLIKSFVAAVLGGLVSLPGAVMGGFTLGVMENLAGAYVSADFKEFIPMVVVMLVLMIRPQGIFGGKAIRKV